MSGLANEGRPVQIRIGRIAIAAASGLEARRLADALPAALERALSGLGAAPLPRRPHPPADQVAAQVVAALAARMRAQP